MTPFFRWSIGLALLLCGLFLFVAWGASLHAGPLFRPDEPQHWVAYAFIVALCAAGLLILSKGRPFRR